MKIEHGYSPNEELQRIDKALDQGAIAGFIFGVLWTIAIGALVFGLFH